MAAMEAASTTSWILEAIKKAKHQRRRPEEEYISKLVSMSHGLDRDSVLRQLERCVSDGTILRVSSRGLISYKDPNDQSRLDFPRPRGGSSSRGKGGGRGRGSHHAETTKPEIDWSNLIKMEQELASGGSSVNSTKTANATFTTWILEAIKKAETRRWRPSEDYICKDVAASYGLDVRTVLEQLKLCVKDGTVLKGSFRGVISYKDPSNPGRGLNFGLKKEKVRRERGEEGDTGRGRGRGRGGGISMSSFHHDKQLKAKLKAERIAKIKGERIPKVKAERVPKVKAERVPKLKAECVPKGSKKGSVPFKNLQLPMAFPDASSSSRGARGRGWPTTATGGRSSYRKWWLDWNKLDWKNLMKLALHESDGSTLKNTKKADILPQIIVATAAHQLNLQEDTTGSNFVVQWEEDKTFGVIQKTDIMSTEPLSYGSRVLAKYGQRGRSAIILFQSDSPESVLYNLASKLDGGVNTGHKEVHKTQTVRKQSRPSKITEDPLPDEGLASPATPVTPVTPVTQTNGGRLNGQSMPWPDLTGYESSSTVMSSDSSSTFMSSEMESSSFSDSEEDETASRFSASTEQSSSYRLMRRHRHRRRKPKAPRMDRSSFSSFTDGTLMTVTLNMEKYKYLGMSIVGQITKRGEHRIYIDSIMEGGAVAADGHIEPGDMLLQVNDINFDNMSNDDAVQVLREIMLKPGPIILTVAKCSEPIPRGCFTLARSEPIRPLDPATWVSHTAAMTAAYPAYDVQQVSVAEPPQVKEEQGVWRTSQGAQQPEGLQQDIQQVSVSDAPRIKEEQEPWTGPGPQQLPGLQSDTTDSTFTLPPENTHCDPEDPSQLHAPNSHPSGTRDFSINTQAKELIEAQSGSGEPGCASPPPTGAPNCPIVQREEPYPYEESDVIKVVIP